jgi:hypothetical protein
MPYVVKERSEKRTKEENRDEIKELATPAARIAQKVLAQ